ncbi:MAG: hypothetical protein EZS28_017850, partial [Streblomastix strix]
RTVAPILDISAAYLQKLVSKAGKPSRETPSRQRFDEQGERIFIAEIIERFYYAKPFNTESFMEYVFEETLEVIIRHCKRSFLSRYSDEATEKYCKIRKEVRMSVIMEDVNSYRGELHTKIVGDPNCAVQALDECGAQDWPDAKPMLMLVPSRVTEAQCFYKVRRNGSLHSVLPCINLSGERIIPLIMTKRKTLDAEVVAHGL